MMLGSNSLKDRMNNQDKEPNQIQKNNDNTNFMLLAIDALKLLYPSMSGLINPSSEKLKNNLEKLKLKLQQEQYKNLNGNCPDCNGSGKITLLISTVDCEKCKNIQTQQIKDENLPTCSHDECLPNKYCAVKIFQKLNMLLKEKLNDKLQNK